MVLMFLYTAISYWRLNRRIDTAVRYRDNIFQSENVSSPFVAKICRNFALKKLDWKAAAKRNAEVVSLTQEMETCIPDETRERELDSRELGRILDAFLRTLSDENQMVFLRRYWYVDTIAEIAVRYGISESAVQMRLIRTRSKLAEYLAKEGIKV